MSKLREFYLEKFGNFYGECQPSSKSIFVREVSPAYDAAVEKMESALKSLVGYEPFENTLEPRKASEALEAYRKANG